MSGEAQAVRAARPRRIAVSLRSFRPGRIGGTETYLRNLVEELPRHSSGDALVAVMDRDLATALPTPGFERVVVDRGARRIIAGRVLEAFTPWRDRPLERLFDAIRADVALFPQQSLYPRDVRTPSVVTVADVQHLVFPEYFPLFDRLYRPRIYPQSMSRARRIIAISEFTRSELVIRCRIAAEKIAVVPHGVVAAHANELAPLDGLDAPYLYCPAASFPHKGHETLLVTYAELRRKGRMPYPLVLTGMQTVHWRTLARRIEALGIAKDVRHLGFLPFADVQRVYAGAVAVVLPTRYEGFGLPAIEAIAHQKKVIVSDIPAFREIGVPAAWRIDFADPEQLSAAIARPGPTRLERTPATWAECARRTLEVLREAAGGAGR